MIQRLESKEQKDDVFTKVFEQKYSIISWSYLRDGDCDYPKAKGWEKRTKYDL